MRPVAGQWKSSGNMDTYSSKAGRQEVVGGAKGKAKGRQGKENRGERGGKWRGGKMSGEGRGGLGRVGNTSVIWKVGGKDRTLDAPA